MEKYGDAHREAKKERRERVGGNKCEVTGETKGQMDAHHNSPKCLDGADIVGNIMQIKNHYHMYIHKICNVDDAPRFTQRKKHARALYLDPTSQKAAEHEEALRRLDEVLMHQWATNLFTKIGDQTQMKLNILSVVRNLETIRDQRIEMRKMEILLQQKDEEIAELKRTRGNNNNNLYTL